MGLDITFKAEKPIICPHCGGTAAYKRVEVAASGGRSWYDFIEAVGGELPYKSLNIDDLDRYAEDYVLTQDELNFLQRFCEQNEFIYNCDDVLTVCNMVLSHEGWRLVINADW